MLRKRLGLPPQPFLYFESLWDAFFHKGNLTLLLALYQDKIIAGHLLFKYKRRVSGEFAAWHQEDQHLRAHHFLIWEGIKLAYEQGYRIYDGGRTASDNIGLLKFKERWGMKSSELRVFHYPRERAERKETFRKLPYSMAKRLVQKMPNSILKIMGQLCYQHMG